MKEGLRAGFKALDGMSLNMFSDDEIFEIHCATLRVFQETGVRVLAVDAQDIFDGGGCTVDHKTNIVKIPLMLLKMQSDRRQAVLCWAE